MFKIHKISIILYYTTLFLYLMLTEDCLQFSSGKFGKIQP